MNNDRHRPVRGITALAAAMTLAIAGVASVPTAAAAAASPAPKGARFTPHMTWDDVVRLEKTFGVHYASTAQWTLSIAIPDRMTLIPPLKPEYMAQFQNWLARARAGKADVPQAAGWPSGMPRHLFFGYAPTFLFQPGNRILLVTNSEIRQIWMDGRGHPAKVDPKDTATGWLGHSVGWWEGDTLVIDTRGFAPEHQLFYNVPNGGDMHITERWHVEHDGLHLHAVIYSSRLAKPWVLDRLYPDPAAASAMDRGFAMRAQGLVQTSVQRPGLGRDKADTVDLTPPAEGTGLQKAAH